MTPNRRWFHWVLAVQGFYYAVTALLPVIHFEHFRILVALPINEFQAWAFAALALPLGVALAAAGIRRTHTLFAARLGAGVALALAFTELVWLPRYAGRGALWLDLPVELAFAVA
ncbi:MAG: hypothetical protein ACREKI_01115, partial [Gemmatimonadota bacterium]